MSTFMRAIVFNSASNLIKMQILVIIIISDTVEEQVHYYKHYIK